MKESNKMKCECCKYWNGLSTECRKNPPAPVYIGLGQVKNMWPKTKPTDWCWSHSTDQNRIGE
jgi:hypothetical protein